jgi:hypothetical protein
MMFVTTLFNYVRDDWDAKVVMECVDYKRKRRRRKIAVHMRSVTICIFLSRRLVMA